MNKEIKNYLFSDIYEVEEEHSSKSAIWLKIVNIQIIKN